MIDKKKLGIFEEYFLKMMDNRKNKLHPLVWIHGSPRIGRNVYVGGFSEINANGAKVAIGDNCDIASFVAINVADSHKKCIGIKPESECSDITIGKNVFIGSHSVIKGGVYIGHHSVVAAGTIVDSGQFPPYSLIYGNPMKIKKGYYISRKKNANENKAQ